MSRSISLDDVESLARATYAELEAARGGGRTRLLTFGEVCNALIRHRDAEVAYPDLEVVTKVCGGHVANSYRGPATTDVVRIETLLREDGEFHLNAYGYRGNASHRPYGKGATLAVRVRGPGQTQGRLVHSE